MRRWLILVSIASLIALMLATALLGSRYATGGAFFQLATLLNQLGRPIVALIFVAVLVARFRDIWSRRVNVDEETSSGIAKVAQTTGIVLLIFSYFVLLLIVYFLVAVPLRQRAEAPVFFKLAPLLTALPAGYFLFEIGRLIDKDRRSAERSGA